MKWESAESELCVNAATGQSRRGRPRAGGAGRSRCTPTWGGFTAREGLQLLRGLSGLDIVAVDINTVSPPHDVNGMAAHLAAYMTYEALLLIEEKTGYREAAT